MGVGVDQVVKVLLLPSQFTKKQKAVFKMRCDECVYCGEHTHLEWGWCDYPVTLSPEMMKGLPVDLPRKEDCPFFTKNKKGFYEHTIDAC